ncbi:MAG TPA: AsmA-like C-terminal region-containing protein [Patescibacteria group bacterium]|nr:AsmA-like C-terminal region-containing protein [Patescibacteria group bacterium]
MKKVLIILGVLLVVCVGALVAIPLFFKDEITALAKQTINKNLKADADFKSVDVSLLKDFPRLHFAMENFSVVNRAPFKDTLAYIPSLGVSLDAWDYITSQKVSILAVNVEKPRITAHVLKDSTKNWDIFIEDKTAPTAQNDDLLKNISGELQEYAINDATITFVNDASDMSAILKNFSTRGKGDFSQQIFTLETESNGLTSFTMGAIPYLRDAVTKLDADLQFDMNKKQIVLKENELLLNELPVEFSGIVNLLEDAYGIDLNFKAKESSFKSFLSLIPAFYTNKVKDFKSLRTSGTMGFEGAVKGTYSENTLPGFNVALEVNNGMFQYPDLPSAVRNVAADVRITNPDGVPNHTVVDIRRGHAEMDGDPFDAKLYLKTPISDPYIDGTFKGKINLTNVKKFFPLEQGTDIGGIVGGDVVVKGNLSTLENKQYERFTAQGAGYAQNLVVKSSQLAETVTITNANLAFTPQAAQLTNLAMKIGGSDVSGSGKLENLLAYVLKDEELRGEMNITSNVMNLNPWMPKETAQSQKSSATGKEFEKTIVTDLPENLNFRFSATMGRVLYDNLVLADVRGIMTLANKILRIEQSSMNLLGGSMTMSGSYNTQTPGKPESSLDLAVKNFSFAETYKAFATAQAFVPFMELLKGSFDAKMRFETDLDGKLMPIFPSVTSVGGLAIDQVRVEGFKPFVQVANLLKMPELANPQLTNIKPSYKIEAGRLLLPAFAFKVGDKDVTMSGSSGLDKSIDYTMNMKVPTGTLASQANQALSGLLKTNISAVSAKAVDVAIKITGTFDNPKISTTLGNVVQDQIDNTKQALEDEAKRRLEEERAKIDQRLKEEEAKLREKANAESEKARQKIEEEKERLRQAAEAEKERLRKEAEAEKERLKKQAEEELKKRFPFGKKP